MKVKLKKLYNFITNPLGFLLISIIILLVIAHYGEEINKPKKITASPIPQYSNLVLNNDEEIKYSDLSEVTKRTLDEELNMLLINSELDFVRSSRRDNYIQYEVQYTGSDELYLKKRNIELENKVQELSLQLKDLWTEYGFDYMTVRVMLLSEENVERVLFDVEDGVVTFTIHDAEKTEATRDDWIFLFKYMYQREPNEEELDSFIQQQEELYNNVDI